MLIPIPITRHTAILEGSAPILVHCEQCGLEYVYTAERVVQGQSTNLLFMNHREAEARACQEASQALAAHLQNACDPVPCPSCGTYQTAMVQRMRIYYLHGMFQLGVVLCSLSPFALLVTLFASLVASDTGGMAASIIVGLLWLVTLSMLATGIALLIVRARRHRRFDPNDEDLETRRHLGQRLALPKDEYVKMVRELRKNHLL